MVSKRFPISLRELEVVAVRDVSPRLRRITFGGAQMGAFEANGFSIPPFASEGPDDHVKMFFPHPETGVLTVPTQADGHLNWPSEPRPTAREYTPRSFDAAQNTCDFEFVMHDHGIAGDWAAKAKVGDTLFFAGPKASLILPQADWFLLVGDETALPAIGNWLEMLPPDAKVTALIFIEDAAAEIALKAPANAVISWHHHDPREAATLRDIVAKLELPAGNGFVWGGGEREAIRLLRAHLLGDRGLGKSQVDVSAYWYFGVDDSMVEAAYDKLNALSDLAGPFALRAAATFDLPTHIAAGATNVEKLAAASGCDPVFLAPLVEILIEDEVLGGTPDALTLAAIGQILLENEHARGHLDLNAAPGRMSAAWGGLVAALAGADGYASVHGNAYRAEAASPERAADFADEHGHALEDAAEDAAKVIVLRDAAHVVDVEGGEGAFLNEVLERHAGFTGSVVDRPEVIELAREALVASGKSGRVSLVAQTPAEKLPAGADAYLLGAVLGRLPDAEAVARLKSVAAAMAPESRLFVLEPGASDDARERLERQLAHGALRAHDAVPALANAAGLAQVRRSALPDGFVLFEFATA